ncbi:hypothetical protein M885DRAFT_517706 [Pelagophyceae sp. CCMP2097]|nr:hypothetical protein M885DRAFT_517706 [Pelagophyceae sp. CCMP2097]
MFGSASMPGLGAPGSAPGKRGKHKNNLMLEPLDSGAAPASKASKRPFTKKDLAEAVRKLTASQTLEHSVASTPAPPQAPSPDSSTKKAGLTPLALMEWGVNFNARKFNELRTQADKRAAALKGRLDTLRALKMEQDALESMLSPGSEGAQQIDALLRKIAAVSEETDRKLHYRRQLEQMLRRLQLNRAAFDSHLGAMDEARKAALREHQAMEAMCRAIEAGATRAMLDVADGQRSAAVERHERALALQQRRTEAEQASRMDEWRRQRDVARREFASELKGDLSLEEEARLQEALRQHRATLMSLRVDHEVLQRDASSLEAAFVSVRQATGVNSLDEVVEKFVGQQGTRRALTAEKREAEDRLSHAKKAKVASEARFADLKASGVGSSELTRDVAEQLEREIGAARVELKASNAGCDRLEAVLVALRQGAVGLYQRLRPFCHLLDGEGALPTAALEGDAGLAAIDSVDAIALSEVLLSKMVELIGGGGDGALLESDGLRLDAGDDSEDEALPQPRHNIRVRSDAAKRQQDAHVGTAREESARRRPEAAHDTLAVAPAAQAADAAAGAPSPKAKRPPSPDDAAPPGAPAALDETVPSRTFLKLSSSRQHTEMLRKVETQARAKRFGDRDAAPAADAGGAAAAEAQSRAAKVRGQAEATSRLTAIRAGAPKPFSAVKDSALDRSVLFLTQTPDLL